MKNPPPTFPPLVTGHPVAAGTDPVSKARSLVSKGRLGAGDLVWSEDVANLQFALVMEPDVERDRCGEMLFAGMVAFGDTIGAIAPPEISVTYGWPNLILMNGAGLGHCTLLVSDAEENGFPQWMILGLDARINPRSENMDPGLDTTRTTMWDEGCGDLSRTRLLESIARHLVNVIHTWSEDGFKPIHQQWWGRLDEKNPLVFTGLTGEGAKLVGLDERGNALIKNGDTVTSIETLKALSDEIAGGVS